MSVPSNIAEGWGRGAGQDHIRFLRNARGSLYELTTQIDLCKRLGYGGGWNAVTTLADDVRRLSSTELRLLHWLCQAYLVVRKKAYLGSIIFF